MIINGSTYVFNLNIVDLETNEEVYDKYFETLELLNEEMESKRIKEPFDSKITLQICSLHGDDLGPLFDRELDMVFPLDYDEMDEIMETLKSEAYPHRRFLTTSIPRYTSQRLGPKTENLETYSYVCPHCWHTVEDCLCNRYPYFLVQIDKNILYAIRGLNQKHYETGSSCEGHIEDHYPNIQVLFVENYKFDNFPEGFEYEGSGNLTYRIEGDDFETWNKNKQEALIRLNEWVDQLPEAEIIDEYIR